MKAHYYIGIDVGVNTGISVWDTRAQKFLSIETMKIHKAMELVAVAFEEFEMDVFVRFEDARLRKWFGNSGREKLMGAGSIKRDSLVWFDFLTDMKIPFEAVAPRNNVTKLSSEAFAKMTGWKERTSEHARDGAMLVWKM